MSAEKIDNTSVVEKNITILLGNRLPQKGKERKFQQIIWLPVPTFAKLLEMSNKLGIAPNVICAEIIRQFFEGQLQPSIELQ